MSSETDTVKISIVKLIEPKQWTTWKFQIQIILKSQDLWNVVIKKELPPKENESKGDPKLQTAYDKKDITAQRILITALGEQPLTHIITCNSASEMWSKLVSVFEQKSSQSIHFLQQKFFGFEKSAGDDMASYISKMEEIVKQLSDLDTKIPDSMVMTKILMSLPSSFNHFHSAWESTAAAERTLDNLRTRLMIEEKRMQSQEGSEESGALFAKRTRSKKFANYKKDKKPGRCFICDKDTHWKKDCPSRGNGSAKALISECLIANDYKDMWCLDSGATEHMSKRREWFTDYEQLSELRPVRIGNGALINAVGKGNIEVSSFNGQDWMNKILLNVLHVPDLHANLFSQGRTCDKGCIFISDDEKCEFINISSGEVVATGVRETGLFRMLICKNVDSANIAVKSESIRVWHKRLAHQNVAHVKRFLQQRNIPFSAEKFQCEPCIFGKQHRLSFKERVEKETECGAIIHADVCGYMDIKSLGGTLYFLLLKDDFSHFRTVYFLKKKSEVPERIKEFVRLTHNQTKHRIKIVRSDNGTEFVNSTLKLFYANEGIKQQTTIPYTPEQNGTVERENRTVVEAARTLLHEHSLNKNLWAEAVNASVYVLNCSGTSTVKGKTPYQLWFNKDANLDKLKEFGTIVYTHIPKEKRKKFDKKAVKCVLVGYCDNGYRIYNPNTKQVQVSRDLIFGNDEKNTEQNIESVNASKEKVPNKVDESQECAILHFFKVNNNENIENEVNDQSDNEFQDVDQSISQENGEESEHNESSSSDVTIIGAEESGRNGSEICDLTQRNVIGDRLRPRSASTSDDNVDSAMLAIYEPQNFDDAMKSPEKEKWLEAMREEYASLIKNKTWTLVDLPAGEKVIDNRWVYKVKINPDESLERFKARLVAKGFTQKYGINYTETFSPVVRFTSIRSILAVAAKNKMTLKQFDIKTAFLNGELEDNIFMKQPIGFSDGTNKVCKLLKSLYGLKQASRCWNQKFTCFIKDFKFVQSDADPCVFIRKVNGETILLAIYVDDGLLAATNESCFNPVIKFLQKHFEVKEFEAKCYLGLQIEQMVDGSIKISQEAYTKRVIERFGMVDAHPVSTPMDNHRVLDTNVNGKEVIFPYREAVGSLMYLANGTRPDICFAVNFVSRYMEKPTEIHVGAVKRIIKYLKGTLNFGLIYFSNTNFDVRCYSDADYAGCLDTRKSTTGYCVTMGGSILSWCSERQDSVSRSTAESEYIAGSEAVRELVWLKRLLMELIGSFTPNLMMDNASAVKLVKNPEQHKRTKHIDVRYHFIREKYHNKEFNLHEVSSHDQLADIFTKPMPQPRIAYLRDELNVKEL